MSTALSKKDFQQVIILFPWNDDLSQYCCDIYSYLSSGKFLNVFFFLYEKSTSVINNNWNILFCKSCLLKIQVKSSFLMDSLQISEEFLFCYDLCQDLCKVSILKSFILRILERSSLGSLWRSRDRKEPAQFFTIQNLTLVSNYCTYIHVHVF